MKKAILIILLLITGGFMQAQNFHFGAKAGINLNKWNITKGGDPGYDTKTGYELGLISELSLSEKWALTPELYYIYKGVDGAENGRTYSFNLEYIEVPVLIKYYISNGFSIETGPQMGFLLSSGITIEYEGEETNEDLSDMYSSTEFGVNIGTSYKLKNGIFFFARYVVGLSNIIDNSSPADSIEIYNNTFKIGIGYFIN